MKKFNKALTLAAAAAIAGGAVVPAVVTAWGDNSETQKRPVYKYEDLTDVDGKGILGDKVVLNSIENSTIGDERNFVGARVDDGDHGKNNVWDGNQITVEDGKTYIVRLYVHNNNPRDRQVVAKDVTTTFSIPNTSGTKIQVDGLITSSNAVPSEYWDDVVFKSADGRPFYLDYVEGSALLENNGIGKNPGLKLSDNLVKGGVKIGYDSLNGEIPGCFQYASYVSIKVKPVFAGANFLVEKQVRKVGEKTWQETMDAKVGDQVEYQIHYKNTTTNEAKNVIVRDVLPNNVQITSDVTLYNGANPNGKTLKYSKDLTTTGINIGDYAVGGDAYVRFTAKVVDKSLVCGLTKVVNWGQIRVNNDTINDSANLAVKKTCQDNPNKEEKEDNPKINTPVESLPTTGPASVAAGALGAGALVTTTGLYLASRKRA